MEEVQNVTVSNNAAETTVHYKRIDVEGGYMTDIDEIENFKSVQRRDVISNYMLGDFNDIGDYIMTEKVLSGLVGIKKTISNEYNNMIFLKSVSEFAEKNKLEFCIVIKELTEKQGYATAIMKLLEPVNKINGYITNTNSFIVASFTDVNDSNFLDKVKRVFGVVESNDTNGKDDPKVVADIMNRITFLRNCNDMYLSVFATVESEYYHGRLDVLKQDPAYEEILKKYRSLILKANMFLDPNSPQYHAYMNELLDQAIDNALNENPSLKDKLKLAMKELDAKHNSASSKYTKEISDKAIEMMEKEQAVKAPVKAPEKKVEEKKPVKKAETPKVKAAASKPETKKPVKDKGKKKDKGEEEKKKDKTPKNEKVERNQGDGSEKNINLRKQMNAVLGNKLDQISNEHNSDITKSNVKGKSNDIIFNNDSIDLDKGYFQSRIEEAKAREAEEELNKESIKPYSNIIDQVNIDGIKGESISTKEKVSNEPPKVNNYDNNKVNEFGDEGR